MKRVFALEFAVLLLLKTLRSIAFFFHRPVVPALAFRALEDNQFAHDFTCFLKIHPELPI